jgi:glycerol uptake facilitator-like aquaporin
MGTAMIVGGGCGTVCAMKYANYPLGPLGVAGSFGLAVTAAVYTTRDISGAHLNPAITATLAINRPEAIAPSHCLPYIAA